MAGHPNLFISFIKSVAFLIALIVSLVILILACVIGAEIVAPGMGKNWMFMLGYWYGYYHEALIWATAFTGIFGIPSFHLLRQRRLLYFSAIIVCWLVCFMLIKQFYP